MTVTDKMVDRALNAWFASPPSETDQGLERSMRAALEAALARTRKDPMTLDNQGLDAAVEAYWAAGGGTFKGLEAAISVYLKTVGGPETNITHPGDDRANLSDAQRKLDASVTSQEAAIGVARERKAMEVGARYASLTTAEKCALQGDGFLNDYD